MRWIVVTAAILASVVAAHVAGVAGTQPMAGQEPTAVSHVHMPQLLCRFAIPFATPEAIRGTATPTRTPRATATDRPTPTARPSRTPTEAGPGLELPTEPGAIVLQIGWTAANTVGQVWQEMEGTPWLTLYNDGRIIAGHDLMDRTQALFEGRLTNEELQDIMSELAYVVGFYQLADAYDHPTYTKPSMHTYGRVRAGWRIVTIRGWENWLAGRPPDVPGANDAMRLIRFIQGLETDTASRLTEAYEPEKFTVLAQELRPSLIPAAPHWPHATVDVTAIADRAPLIKPSPIDRHPGHLFVDAELGREVRDIVVPFAVQYFAFDYRAAEYRANGRPIAVGVRQEVPGGSPFLPAELRDHLYRRDRDSGDPPLFGAAELPRR